MMMMKENDDKLSASSNMTLENKKKNKQTQYQYLLSKTVSSLDKILFLFQGTSRSLL